MGVNARFFLPRRVTSFTSGDEFHSLKNVTYPSDSSHFCSRAICVLFPDPSIPSTMKSFPGKRCFPYIFIVKASLRPPVANKNPRLFTVRLVKCDEAVKKLFQP